MRFTLLTLAVIVFGSLRSQSVIISGKVIDSKDLQPVPLVSVFISNTTLGNTTELNGEFSFKAQQPGTYELFFSLVGYSSYKINIVIKDQPVNVGIVKLTINEVSIGQIDVKGKRDKAWESDLKKFKKVFLGDTRFSSQFKINNPWVLEFNNDDEKGLVATAGAPIEMENIALGYKVIYHLKSFWSLGVKFAINGIAQFTEVPAPSKEQFVKWQTNRLTSYQSSLQHLFKAMIQKRIYKEGFNLYTDREGYENRGFRSDQFSDELDKSVKAFDTTNLVVSAGSGLYRINFSKRLEVHYRFGELVSRTYRDVVYPVSWITLGRGYVVVNENGFPLNSTEVDVFGEMGRSRLANMLPLDYATETNSNNSQNKHNYLERTFIHTNKEYYYPGETIWFKGYMRYGEPQFQDSLSKTIYVELLNPMLSRVVQSKILEIHNGIFQGNFTLSDSLLQKTHYLRAYTSLQRNFGDNSLFALPVPILSLTDRMRKGRLSGVAGDSLFYIEADKPIYKVKEKITLTVHLKNMDAQGVGSTLSISITDQNQVAPLEITSTALQRFSADLYEEPISKNSLRFPIEKGINFSGKLMNNSEGKTDLNIIQLDANFITSAKVNNGIFRATGPQFYDTAVFSIQTIGKKNMKPEWCTLTRRDQPNLSDFYKTEFSYDINENQKLYNIDRGGIYSEKSTTLDDVKVLGQRLNENRFNRPYGKPDFIIKAKDLNTSTGNLLMAIQGKVPGLMVRQVNNPGEGMRWMVYTQRGANSSILNVKEVGVLVNDNMMSGSPGDIIGSINPADVETVEVKNGINVLYGSAGSSGVVSIYLKKDVKPTSKPEDRNFSTLIVPGYSHSTKFISVDYSLSERNITDNQATIFWEPNLYTDGESGTATVSFYAAHQPTFYRIVVVGLADDGRILRTERIIQIEP